MQVDEDLEIAPMETLRTPQPIASRRHLMGFLLIGVGVVALGFLAQHGSTGRRLASSDSTDKPFPST
jgi:hypothetical protein